MANLRALVVEDSELDYELLVRELRKGGYDLSARRVDTADELVEALQTTSWDIVFSDWSLPGFDAIRALEILRARAPDMPFIIVSGTVGEDVAVDALRRGAQDFIVKTQLTRLLPAIARELRELEVRHERKRMQEQLLISDRMASVGILAAGVAHEINNPLAAVVANLELASDAVARLGGAPVAEVLEELADARIAADRIRSIVRDLKLFSRGGDDEARGAVDLARVLESSLRMAANEIRHRARVVKRLTDVPPVDANESRLGQVFLNLLVNAAQSIPEGRSHANEIRVSTAITPNGSVVVEIADTGCGMPPEVVERLFTPFFTTKPAGFGTGLGLTICHRIVSAFDGRITVQSTPGKGTAFQVHLLPARASLAPERVTPSEPVAPARRGRILLVDDEPTVSTAVRRLLAREHDVVVTGRAREALDRIAAGESFDLILCDLMMPEMTGMDLHDELVRTAPAEAEKMIFLSGGAFTDGARAFLERIPNTRLDKPFDPAALRAIVNERIR